MGERALAELDRRLRAARVKRRARSDAVYLRSDLVFYGVTLPRLHGIAREYVHEHPDLDRRDLRAIALGAFKTRKHDLRSVAIAILDTRHRGAGCRSGGSSRTSGCAAPRSWPSTIC